MQYKIQGFMMVLYKTVQYRLAFDKIPNNHNRNSSFVSIDCKRETTVYKSFLTLFALRVSVRPSVRHRSTVPRRTRVDDRPEPQDT